MSANSYEQRKKDLGVRNQQLNAGKGKSRWMNGSKQKPVEHKGGGRVWKRINGKARKLFGTKGESWEGTQKRTGLEKLAEQAK